MRGARVLDWINRIKNWYVLKCYHWRRCIDRTCYIHLYINDKFLISQIKTNFLPLQKMIDQQEVSPILYRIINFKKHPSLPKLFYQLLYKHPDQRIPVYLNIGKDLLITYGKIRRESNNYVLNLILFRRKSLSPSFVAYREVDVYYQNLGLKLYNDLLKSNQEEESNIPEILSNRPVSRSALFRVFKLTVGVPPNTVRKDYRLYCFKNKLIYSDYSIHHLFLETGFKSKSHLYRLFQEVFEMSPREFRKKYKSVSKWALKNNFQ